MKILIALLFMCVMVGAQAQASEPAEKLVGSYQWMMIGGTWTLRLEKSGAYTLTSQGSVVGSKPELIEGGTWIFESNHVVLKTAAPPVRGTDGGYRQLYRREHADGILALVSVRRDDYVFLRADEKKPNQSPEPTRSACGSS